MNPFRLAGLIGACALAGLLLWWVSRRPETGAPGFTASAPVPRARAPALRLPPPASSPNLRALGERLLAYLQDTLQRPDARANESVLAFRDEEAYRAFLERAEKAGLTVLGQLDGMLTARVRYGALSDLYSEILANAVAYESVGANFILQVPTVPPPEARAAINEVPFGNRMLNYVGATGDRQEWGDGVTIAVLDSGVTLNDPTFVSGQVRMLDIGLGVSPGSAEGDGHGTAVAALAVGSAPDAPGIAPGAEILSIRVTGEDGFSDVFTMSQAIVAAVDAGARVINISMGGYQTGSALVRAIDYASANGSVIVASAGNDQAAQLTWPAADPRVVSVGSVDALEQQDLFSNSGEGLRITAPGYGIQAAWLHGQRITMDGTSASAPIVAGAIAAVMSATPGMSAQAAAAIVQQYSNDAGPAGADENYGAGILNLGWAMNRTDPARVDTAVSSHSYDPLAQQIEYVVQNRSGSSVSGMQLNVSNGGVLQSYAVPTLRAGAIHVVRQAVDGAALAGAGRLEISTQLVNPMGLNDQNTANNRKASVLRAPDIAAK